MDRPVKRVSANGLTLVHERMPHRASIAIGVWLRAGARDEPGPLAGITHFLEHMLFKGTERRNAYDISRSLESLGGHLDAFTAREHVCYYGRALDEHLPQAIDVLADVIGHSTLAEAEVTREKEVVREEIASYEDSPEDKVQDLLAEALWGADPLGRPILGSTESVESFTSPVLQDFYRERYHPGNLVVAVAGSFDPAWLENAVWSGFDAPQGADLPVAIARGHEPPRTVYLSRDVNQLHLGLARPGLRHEDEARYRLAVLNAIVGGGMSSRLFQTLREQHGLAYSVYSSTESYRDTGMITIGLGVKPERGPEALERLRVELTRLAEEGPTEDELESGRAQIRGSLLLGEESVSNHMYHQALDEMYYGEYVPVERHLDEVARVTRTEVIELARQHFPPDGWTLAAVGPRSCEDSIRAAV